MTGFRDIIGEVLSRAARVLGLKPTQAQRLERLQARLGAAKARNVDQLEEIKDEIKTIEARALRTKRELDETRGDRRRIIAGEIERSFGDLDRLRGKEDVYAQNIDRISRTLAKIDQMVAAGYRGIDEDLVDALAQEADEEFAALKAVDRATVELDRVQYHRGERASENAGERTRDGTRDVRSRDEPELSPQARERLRQLEEEE